MIPSNPDWCSYCIQGNGTPCEHHTGPNGSCVEYKGSLSYTPTTSDRSTVGKKYKAWDGRTYLCFGYDPRHGFWMRSVDGGETRQTNVSERAIGRTYHQLREAPTTSG